MSSRPSAKLQPRQDQQENLVEQDVAVLRRIASDPQSDTAVRKKAKHSAEALEYLHSASNALAVAAKATGVDSWCRALNDHDLAHLVADALAGRRSVTYRALSAVAASRFECGDLQSESHVMGFARWLFELCSVALADELARRQEQTENLDARLVRRILVEEKVRGEGIQKIACQRTHGLWIPGDLTEGSQDAASEMATSIWELIADLAGTIPVAANPQALVAFMSGGLNRVLGRARDDVRNKIRTTIRRVKKPDSSSRDEKDDALVLLAEQRLDQTKPCEEWDRRLLVEQLLTRVGLSELEGKVIKLHYFEGKTQEETAASLKVSQGQVSKILDEAHEKLQALAHHAGATRSAQS